MYNKHNSRIIYEIFDRKRWRFYFGPMLLKRTFFGIINNSSCGITILRIHYSHCPETRVGIFVYYIIIVYNVNCSI